MTSEPTGATSGGRSPATRPAAATGVERFHYDDKERLASYRRTAPRPPAARAGALITLLVAVSVLYAEWDLYSQSYQGQSDATWALGFAIVSLGAALRILMGNPGHHYIAGGAIFACGIGFLARALLITENPSPVYVFEIACGVLLLLGALMALLSPELEPEPPPSTDPWG